MSLLDDAIAEFQALPEADRKGIKETVALKTGGMRFVPLPGPQTEAYLSRADVLLYGGQAGGGKSYLLMGLASQEHTRSIIFRRESSQTDGLEEAGKQIIGPTAKYNGTDLEWSWPSGRSLKLAGMKEPYDWQKHAGRERDLIGYDEAGEFLREQVGSLLAWNRGPDGQRCRIVLASNPPRTSDGYWMSEWFAPWLDMHHPSRAAPGELRWAVMLDSPSGLAPQWVGGPDDVVWIEGEADPRTPLSFTFIPAALSDNPFRDTPEYRTKLNSLHEPLRSQLLFGDFTAGAQDSIDQAIPTEWVKAAMNRWKAQPRVGVPMCAIGVDVAQGGTDQTVISIRYDEWFAPLIAIPGKETPGGAEVAGKVIAKRHDGARVVVDLGGGWGGDALAHLTKNGADAIGFMGVKPSTRRTRDNQLRFFNVRTEAYWRLREALDPEQQGGAVICLPNDKELLADLTAATFTTKGEKGGMVIQLEAKEKLVARIGRSPDKGDAVVMAWFSGEKAINDLQVRERRVGGIMGRTPKVVMGRQNARRR